MERKKIRHLYLYVKPGGRVAISAPLGFTQQQIAAFAFSREDWIRRQIEGMRDVPEHTKTRYLLDDGIILWGVKYPLLCYPDKKKSLSFGTERAILTAPVTASAEEKERFVREQLKLRLKRAIAMRLPHWEQEMGLYARGFTVRDMKSRWGSCNLSNAHITFHLQLVTLSPECLDYVCVHELAHLRHRLHDRAFWSLVGTYVPAYRSIRRHMDHGN